MFASIPGPVSRSGPRLRPGSTAVVCPWRLLGDERGFVLSAELVLVVTIAVLGLIVGLNCLATAVVDELQDLGAAFRSLNQSYRFFGMGAFGRCKARVAGSVYLDRLGWPGSGGTWSTGAEIGFGGPSTYTIPTPAPAPAAPPAPCPPAPRVPAAPAPCETVPPAPCPSPSTPPGDCAPCTTVPAAPLPAVPLEPIPQGIPVVPGSPFSYGPGLHVPAPLPAPGPNS